jgi:hypothetical protein
MLQNFRKNSEFKKYVAFETKSQRFSRIAKSGLGTVTTIVATIIMKEIIIQIIVGIASVSFMFSLSFSNCFFMSNMVSPEIGFGVEGRTSIQLSFSLSQYKANGESCNKL